jgi:hypothetical protein
LLATFCPFQLFASIFLLLELGLVILSFFDMLLADFQLFSLSAADNLFNFFYWQLDATA